MFNFLLDLTVPNWVSSSFPVIQAILLILITLNAICIIVAAMILPSNPDGGNNVITGKNESYYGFNKGETREGRLHRMMIICSICIFVFAVVYFITVGIFNGLGA